MAEPDGGEAFLLGSFGDCGAGVGVGVPLGGAGAGAALGPFAETGAPAGAVGETGTVITAEASDNSSDLGNSATTISPAM